MTSSTPASGHATGSMPLDSASALPAGARVAEFEIREVLGTGGFGIVYLAWDHALEREVALKEYMPATLAGRGGDLSVSVRSNSMVETFALGLRSFVNEARMLARFDHPSLVKVHRFWEANGTAYMAMPYYKGRTLRRVRAGMVVPPGEGPCRKVLDALLSALEVLHKEGVFHRDIAPDNILIADDGAGGGTPVLLDFGAARRVIEGEGQKALTSIMKPNFAPLEQYADQSAMRQGPWTDLYALGGTIYFLLSGREPVPAASRALHDDQLPLVDMGLEGVSPHFLQTIDWMLSIKPAERPASVQMLRDVLEGRMALPVRPRERTVPGIASREVDILTGPGELDAPEASAAAAASAATVLMPRAAEAPESAAAAPSTLPPSTLPPVTAPGPLAPAAATPPWSRPSTMVLTGLVVLNILAWWWFTRREPAAPVPPAAVAAGARAASSPAAGAAASAPLPRPVTAAAAASVPVTATAAAAPLPGAGASVPRAGERDNETILSVMPARAVAPRAASAPLAGALASAPASPASAAALRSAAVTPRAASAAVVPPEPADPRVRCGDRNFLSMLVCLKRECASPAVAAHPECVRLREQEAASMRPGSDR